MQSESKEKRERTASDTKAPAWVARIPLALQCGETTVIAAKARNPETGWDVTDRRIGLRKYKRVFSGKDVVDWVYGNVVNLKSREEAHELGQKLMDADLFVPVTKKHLGKPLLDSHWALYAFRTDFDAGSCEDALDVLGTSVVVSSDLVDDLLPSMQDPVNGVPVKDRRYHLKTYPQCFVGCEAVDWLVDDQNISRKKAVEVGQKMLAMGFFEHVTQDHEFKDEGLFYRFVEPGTSGPVLDENTCLYDFTALDIDKEVVKLDTYRDKVVLVVNVASN